MDLEVTVTRFDAPIDVMFLIHKALSAEARQVQEMIEHLEDGGSLQSFRSAFNLWASHLMYHADIEDEHMTAPLTTFQPARNNESEHRELAEMLEDLAASPDNEDSTEVQSRIKQAIIALHEGQHTELMGKLEDVLTVLNGEIGKTSLIARTRRHLYGKIVALRIAQDDHLESEEAFVLPEVGERMSTALQLDLAKLLLIDEEAEDPRWILDSVMRELPTAECKLLEDLEDRFTGSLPASRLAMDELDQAADS